MVGVGCDLRKGRSKERKSGKPWYWEISEFKIFYD
jgi:hypothetical protein